MTLRELRFNAGLSPEQLGEKVDVSGPTIRRLEDDPARRPRPDIALKLASFFDLKPSDIWPLDEEVAAA